MQCRHMVEEPVLYCTVDAFAAMTLAKKSVCCRPVRSMLAAAVVHPNFQTNTACPVEAFTSLSYTVSTSVWDLQLFTNAR